MTDLTPIKPSPALLQATRRALAILAQQWPQKFKFVDGTSTDDQAQVALFASACAYAHLDHLETAARTWVVRSKFAPTVAEFGAIAREVSPAPPSSAPAAYDGPPLPKDIHAVNTLNRRAFARLGDTRLVSECWAFLWTTATNDHERAMVRAGTVPADLFDQAVEKVAAGLRVRAAGPLGRVAV